jgi:multiple sugar transport system permease protein
METKLEVQNQTTKAVKKNKVMNAILNEMSALVFLAPFLVFFIIFYIWPVLKGGYMSFFSWGVAGMNKYVGLKNYVNIINNKDFYTYLWHSFYFLLISAPIILVVGLALAMIINQKIAFRNTIRGMYFLPYVLSVSVVSFIWLRMFDSSSGLVNAILSKIGLPGKINWLTDPHFAWWAIDLTTVWWTVGFVMILFLAGLQEIPRELYEASEIDGANSISKFLYITLPSLSGVIRVQIFFQIIAGLRIFGQPHIMTQGGPGDETNTIIRYIYMTGFKKDQFGMASAQSILFCIVMLIVAALQYRFVNKKD